MTTSDYSYYERVMARQDIITTLVMQGVNMQELLKHNPTTDQLQALLAGIIKLKMLYAGIDVKWIKDIDDNCI